MDTEQHKTVTQQQAEPPRCEATNRKHQQCPRPALAGKQRCHFHSRGAGPPKGNNNARKHGYYSRRAPEDVLQSLDQAYEVEGAAEEIALLRALIDRAVSQGAGLPAVAKGVEVLVRALRAHYGMTDKSHDSLAAAIAEVLERVGGQMGLPEALR